MDRWRRRSWPGIGMAIGILMALVVTPAASAATTCSLSAPTYGNVGSVLAIAGSGFPASTGVDVEITLDGSAFDSFAVQSDASGDFDLQLTPEVADIGVWTVDASAGSSCSAQAVIQVLGAGETPAPEATPAPDGAAAGAGSGSPPRTDAIPGASQSPPAGVPIALWAFGFLVFVSGIGGTLLTRPKRHS
jgi:hypothetical protein